MGSHDRIKKQICFDLRFGELPCEKNNYKKDGISDGLLLDNSKEFHINNSLFYDIKPGLAREQLVKLEKNQKNFKTIGYKVRKLKLNFFSLLKLFYSNLYSFIHIYFNFPKPKLGFTFLDQLNLVKFFTKEFEIKASLSQYSIRKYISFLDYDPVHHIIGQVCHDKKTLFFGIAHSSLHDEGYFKSPSFVSFDHYFIVSKFHSRIHPAWSNNHSMLHDIGPWKSDFIINYSNSKYFSKKIENIKKSLSKFCIISLHLPPLDTFIFNEDSIKNWLNAFLKILITNENIFFILT